MKELILYACGSDLIVDFIEVCAKNDVAIKAIINNLPAFQPKDIGAYTDCSDFNFDNCNVPFLVPLFTPSNRCIAVKEAMGKGLSPFPLLNDRNNDLPVKFKHGNGCFINKRVVIGSNSEIGNYVIINRGACLGHHLQLKDFVSIGPGVVTGGGIIIGNGSLIGTGATILPEIQIGDNCIVGAGAVVTKNVPDKAIVVGNPAKPIGENFKSVMI